MRLESVKDISSDAITFEKAAHEHEAALFHWLTNPHVQEFWDNSQEHKDDIRIFMDGRVVSSPYFEGIFDYWVGLIDREPFALIMTSEILSAEDLPPEWLPYISHMGKTFSIDFMIGNEHFVGKGLAAVTLKKFIEFFSSNVDKEAGVFIIDPEEDNTRAEHVYEKAGFKKVCRFVRNDTPHWLMLQAFTKE